MASMFQLMYGKKVIIYIAFISPVTILYTVHGIFETILCA